MMVMDVNAPKALVWKQLNNLKKVLPSGKVAAVTIA
jgi:hypothetical protein